MNTEKLVSEETQVINTFFKKRNLLARVENPEIIPFAAIVYKLVLDHSVTIATVEGVERELVNSLYNFRVKRHGMPVDTEVKIRVRDMPLALEITHPSPIILIPTDKHLITQPNVGLVGKSCVVKGKIETLDLRDGNTSHTLIAALSNGGKSSLLKSILSTMLLNTSFDYLKVVLIDLKNTDLVPFAKLPHTLAYASTVEQAISVVAWVKSECEARKQSGQRDYKLLLVFDELAELTKVKNKEVAQAIANLSSIMNVGRSLDVCTICATQYPNKETLGILNTSFQLRYVGRMDSVISANVAAKRSGSGAENLTNPGDFVRVGSSLERVKTFYFDDKLTERMVAEIEKKWRKHVNKTFVATDISASSTPSSTISHPLFETISTKKRVEEMVEEPSTMPSHAPEASTLMVEPSSTIAKSSTMVEEVVEPSTDILKFNGDSEFVKQCAIIKQGLSDEWSKNRICKLAFNGNGYAGSYARKFDKIVEFLKNESQ